VDQSSLLSTEQGQNKKLEGDRRGEERKRERMLNGETDEAEGTNSCHRTEKKKKERQSLKYPDPNSRLKIYGKKTGINRHSAS